MTYKELFKAYVLKRPLWAILIIISGVTGGLFNGISTALVVPIALFILDPKLLEQRALPEVFENLLSVFERFEGDTKLIVMVVSVVALIGLKNLSQYLRSLLTSHYSRIIILDLKLAGLKIITSVDLDFFNRNNSALLINTINQQINLTAAAIRIPLNLFIQSVNIAIFSSILISISWQLTIVTIGLSTILALSNQVFIRNSKKFGRILTKKSRSYSRRILDLFTGIRLIKTIAQEQQEYKRIKALAQDYQRSQFQLQIISAGLGPVNEMSSIIVLYTILLAGRFLFFDQLQSLATILLTYLVILIRLLPMVTSLNKTRTKLAQSTAAVEVSGQFLRLDDKPFMNPGTNPYHPLQEGIHFQNVSFSYPTTQKLVLENIDLFIPKGKTIALVGESGSGKSTTADLLTRFYDPSEGRITLDGIDLRDIRLKEFRGALGVVGQDTFLFNDTVRYNMSYGLPQATDEEIALAAKRANAYDFICRLPEGFDTKIGDRGVLLSGGQRQRLAIARALLRNPDILILDEATSALDTASERLVQQAIEELCHDRTTLVIAHRLSTIRNAYKIVVMDQGKIAEMGSHEELIAKDGIYANLSAMQFVDPASAEKEFAQRPDAFDSWQLAISHEARTRLNGMLGLLRLIEEDLFDEPEEKFELIEECYDSALQLLNSIEQIELKTA